VETESATISLLFVKLTGIYTISLEKSSVEHLGAAVFDLQNLVGVEHDVDAIC
jgi:hypothetical protein